MTAPQSFAEYTSRAHQRIIDLAEQHQRTAYTPIHGTAPFTPTREHYQSVDRLLAEKMQQPGHDAGELARLRCWLADTRPEMEPSGWETWRPIIRLLSAATLLLGAVVIAGLIWTGGA